MKNFIINLLSLKQEDVESINIEHFPSHNIIHIRLTRHPCKCPACFKMTSKVKEYKTREYVHQIIYHMDTYIKYDLRRMSCPYCGKTFNEDNPFDKTYSSMTNFTLISILKDLKHYTATYTSVANRYGVSPTTVMRIFDHHVQIKRHSLQEIICIDEFYFNRHSKYKYAFLIMGFRNKLILDIVESRRGEKLNDYFFSIPVKEREIVTFVCMDMYQHYRLLIRLYFPKATICVDSFHVLKKITDCLNSVRKRMMRRYADNKESAEYKLLKYRYKLLLKSGDFINNSDYFFDRTLGYTTCESGVLECILSLNKDLRMAYLLKEEYRMFNDTTEEKYNKEEYTYHLKRIIDAMISSNIKEMIDAGKTLKSWATEIINSFHWVEGRRVSNGCIEGKNNYIKKILSNGNGMTNFDRARNRMMYSQNQFDTYTISIKNKTIKKPGKIRGKYKKSE